MPLPGGTRVGSYEIISLLGAGGMGEVYRARDARLQRDVALKILPEHLTGDAERLARFQREAQVLAALAHANIAHIYAIEETPAAAGGTRALVLELVDGPTLADRIAQGPIPADEAIAIAKQIAEALDAAHEQGIVHRDLKPANIKLREDGTVKVLDFGLAKLGADNADGSSLGGSLSPTLSVAFTGAGTILGTAAYMAPEQARGKKVDKRADVWGFGCVLFEMLAGAKAFDGTDATEMIAAVVRGEPAWSALPADTPPAVIALLRRCLQKDPRQRLRDIGDARYELEHANAPVAPVAAASPARPSRRRIAAWAAAALLLALGAGVGAWILKPEPEQAIRKFEVQLPANQPFTFAGRHMVAVSTQGHLAYAADNQIFLRLRDQLAATQVTETKGSVINAPRNPFFSPDGQWLGFWADNQLQKVAITGGAAVPLTRANIPWGVSWSADGTILYGQGPEGIYRVSENGGTGEQIIKVKPPESAHGPQMLPDGHTVLFTLAPQPQAWNQAKIVAHSLDTGTRTDLLSGGTDARYVATGHLVYAANGTLLGVPFDVSSLKAIGGPVALVENVAQTNVGQTGATQFALTPDGTLVYIPAASVISSAGNRTLVWIDRNGRETPLKVAPRAYRYLNISGDGRRVAFDSQDENRDLFILSLTTGITTPITFDETLDQYPVWTPNDERIIYASAMEGPTNLFWRAANGSGKPERLLKSDVPQLPQAVTPDGSQLIFVEITTDRGENLMITPLSGERRAMPLIATEARERNAALSPDGNWLAYESNKSNRDEIWVTPFPVSPAKGEWKVSVQGGTRPLWVSNGELAFIEPGDGGTARLMSVAVKELNGALQAAPPEKVLDTVDRYTVLPVGRSFDFSPDGRRLLAVRTLPSSTAEPESASKMILIQNWFEELKRRVVAR
jgi:serine/threonine-protein kinase